MLAQKVIFAAIADAARVGFDTAEKIEARYFQRLLLHQAARNMMTTFFVQMNALDGGCFSAHAEDGSKMMWAGLKETFVPNGYIDVPYQDIKDRLLFSQVVEALRILEEGIIGNVGDGNIDSIMGIGFPPHTGGVYQCVDAYGL